VYTSLVAMVSAVYWLRRLRLPTATLTATKVTIAAATSPFTCLNSRYRAMAVNR
jgi:hypothetical protein